MNNQQVNAFVRELYHAVDNKDVEYLKNNLAEQISFSIGNNPVATDKAAILEANSQFFSSIESMAHTIEGVVFQGTETKDVTKISCHGCVNYVRKDGTKHSAVFSTFLAVQHALIIDYRVFADLSGL